MYQNSLFLLKEDAFSQWGLFYSKFPADPIGEQIINNFTIQKIMFVKYQINLSTVPSGTTATTINVPINMDFLVGQSEEIEEKL
jgi:hypothetical protein